MRSSHKIIAKFVFLLTTLLAMPRYLYAETVFESATGSAATETTGTYSISADIAVANFDTGTNSAPGRFELLVDGAIVDSVNYNGTGGIDPGEVFRNSLSGTVVGLEAGQHSLIFQILRPLLNSREIYQYVDNVTLESTDPLAAVQVVPEPGNLVMLSLGISAALCRRRSERTRRIRVH